MKVHIILKEYGYFEETETSFTSACVISFSVTYDFADWITISGDGSDSHDILVQNSPATIQQIKDADSSLDTNKIENFVNDFSNLIQSSGPVTEANLHDKFYSAAVEMMFSSNADDQQVASDVIKAFHIDPTSSTFPPHLLPLKEAIKTQLLGGSTSTSTTTSGGGGGPAPTSTTSPDDSAAMDAAMKNTVDQHVKLTLDAAQKAFAFSLTQLDSMKKSGQSLDLAI